MATTPTAPAHDVLVIGGGAAGLSAAVALGRARRSLLVVDDGHPRNAPAAGVHNFLTRDGMPPADLLAAGRAEVARYGGELRTGRAVGARAVDGGFAVRLEDGDTVVGRQLVVATGLTDELPDLPGIREQWGHGVLHCPYCHGWEVRDQPLGVLAGSAFSVHQALLFRQWTSDLTLFVHTAPEPTSDELTQLRARGIAVVRGEVVALESDPTGVTGIRLADGTVVARRGLVVAPRAVASSAVLDELGVPTAPHPMGADLGEVYAHDPTGATAVPGVWVAGNAGDVQAQVITAAAQGLLTGATVNAALVAADTAAAVSALGHVS